MTTAQHLASLTDRELSVELHRLLLDDDLTNDLENPEHIAKAVNDWFFSGYGRKQIPPSVGPLGAWENRDGNPWQESIESHVKAHRRDPRIGK
jgi:hypothetical protein